MTPPRTPPTHHRTPNAVPSAGSPDIATQDHVASVIDSWAIERPNLDASPVGIIGRLHRLANALTEELVAVYTQFGLAEGEFDVLATLRRSGPPYERAAGDLSLETMVTTGGMTKRLDRLEQRGLITRRVSPSDARGRIVTLTAAGVDLIDAAFTAHVANEHRLLADLPATDRRDLERLLRTWLAHHEHPRG